MCYIYACGPRYDVGQKFEHLYLVIGAVMFGSLRSNPSDDQPPPWEFFYIDVPKFSFHMYNNDAHNKKSKLRSPPTPLGLRRRPIFIINHNWHEKFRIIATTYNSGSHCQFHQALSRRSTFLGGSVNSKVKDSSCRVQGKIYIYMVQNNCLILVCA